MQLKSLAQTQSVLADINNAAGDLRLLKDIGKTYTTETLKAALAQSTLEQAQIKVILSGNGLQGTMLATTAEELHNAASTHAVAEAQKKAAGSTIGLSTALKGLWLKIQSVTASLWAFLTTNPVGWLTLVAGAFAAAAFGVKKYNEHLEEVKQKTREAAVEAKEAAADIRSSFETLSSDTNEIKGKYAELAQEVENLGKANQSRGTLSAEDYDEFLDLSSRLAAMFPQLTAGYDENGNALLNLSGDVDTIVNSLNNLVDVQQRLAKQQILDKMPEIWAGYTLDAEEYKKALADAQRLSDSVTKAVSQINNNRSISYDLISNGRLLTESEILNTDIHEALREIGIGNAGNDWNGTFQTHSSNFNPDIDGFDTQRVSWDFSSLTEEQFQLLQERLGTLSSEYEYATILARNRVEAADAELSEYLNNWLSLDLIYESMNPLLQNAARSVFSDAGWTALLPENLDTGNWNSVLKWIQENILVNINKVQNDPLISKALSEIFTNTELTPPEANGYLKQLQNYFGDDSALAVILQPRLQEAEELQSRYQDAISRFGEDSRQQLTDFFRSHSINNSQEIDYWNKVTKGAQSAAEAFTLYRESVTAPITPASSSQLLHQLDTRLSPVFDSLGSAYSSIFADGSFHPDSLNIPMLDSIRSSIEELNSLEDVDIHIDMDSFDSLASTLTSAGVTQQQAEQAFNDFATSVFYASRSTEGMTDETRELVEQMLKSLGVTNAAEAAEYALMDAKAKALTASYDLGKASEEEFCSLLAESEAAGLARQQLYHLTAAEIAFTQNGLSTEEKIAQLKSLASAYGDTASSALATAIASDLASGHTDPDTAIQELMARINNGINRVEIDFSGLKDSAARAGREAGRSYSDALKDELSDLNSLLRYAGTIIDGQISRFQEQKEAAVEALEAEKEAAKEALEAEKAALQEKIDAKQQEIDAIEEAARARKDEISLQQKQYNLARLHSQKTILQYSQDRGLHYAADTAGIREAEDALQEAKENLLIAGMEKEISGLDDALDSLDRKIEESGRCYDSLIQETEKYWDSLIQGLEEYKARWQELSGIEEQARMEAALQNLGISTEDILNMSDSAFQTFQAHYLGVLQQMYSGSSDILEILQRVGGVSAESLRPLAGDLDAVAAGIRNVSSSISGGQNGEKTGRPADGAGISKSRTGSPKADASLIGSVQTLGETTAETLGEPDGSGVTGHFGELSQAVAGVASHTADIIGQMEELDGMTASCTVTVHIETTGDIPEYASGTGLGEAVSSIGSNVGSHTASKGKAPAGNGSAKGNTASHTKIRGRSDVNGDWGVREAGRTLVGELGRELWVHAADGTFETVGDSGPEFIHTQKGDLLFDHLQTEELLENGHIARPGNISLDGTRYPAIPQVSAVTRNLTGQAAPISAAPRPVEEDIVITPEGAVLVPYDPDRDPTPFGDAFRKWHAHTDRLSSREREAFLPPGAMYDSSRQVQESINRLQSTILSTQNIRPGISVGDINITCPGVTSQAVMREVGVALDRKFSGLRNYTDQWIRRR